MLMEVFNPPEQVEPLIQRLEVVGKHAAGALYNAAEMKRVPFGFIWRPIAKVQDGLGGKARFYWSLGAVALVLLAAVMVLVPYPLKMEAKGELLPKENHYVFAPNEGEIQKFLVTPGAMIRPGTPMVRLFNPTLLNTYASAEHEASAAEKMAGMLAEKLSQGNLSRDQEEGYRRELAKSEATAKTKRDLMQAMRRMYSLVPGQLGQFDARAPEFEDPNTRGGMWRVLSADNRPELMKRTVKPNEPLLRIGYVDGRWRVEMKIPQRNIGHITHALETPGLHKTDKDGKKYLDVDVLLTSKSDSSFPGRLYEEDMAREAIPNRDDHNESEPVMMAYVRVNTDDVSADRKIPKELFVAGQEVHTRIRCGKHAMGYSLFHGVWEWFYEKVVFFF
jgi:hypothetical protein